MAIQRQVKTAVISPGRLRYRVIVTGEECPPHTHEAKHHQHLFMQWLTDNQTLLECGYSPFEKLSISHNGTAWEAIAEAEVDEEPT